MADIYDFVEVEFDENEFVVEIPLDPDPRIGPGIASVTNIQRDSSGNEEEDDTPAHANHHLPPLSSEEEYEDDDEGNNLFVEVDAVDNAEAEEFPSLSLENFSRDSEHEEDLGNGWMWIHEDSADFPAFIPFQNPVEPLNMITPGKKAEDFFNALFDARMWSQICEKTNKYARTRQADLGIDPVEAMDNEGYARHARLNFWKDITETELKVFVAHLIVMGIVRKPDIESYWKKKGACRTPFFGTYMSRNRFTAILANIHVDDDTLNPPYPDENHDPLAKLQSFISMCNDNFKFAYKPRKELSLDEACIPWKGRLRFKLYNPRKPAKFHIKLFQVSEAESGYILGFSIYTGKDSCVENNSTVDLTCGTTTKTVLTLANNTGVLDKGHTMFFDNYYTSPELAEELLYRDTHCVGTVRGNRKGLPQAVKIANLKPGETCFRRSVADPDSSIPLPGGLLCLKWHDKKKAVLMLTTCHSAEEKWTGKRHRIQQNPIYKPTAVLEYTKYMGGVDRSDQLLNYYTFLRKSVKWWRKVWVHLLNMIILNAYILNKKFGEDCKLSHEQYRELLASYLVKDAQKKAREDAQDPLDIDQERLVGRHFIRGIGGKKTLTCKVCFIGKTESKATGRRQRRKTTSFWCPECSMAMCIQPCFEAFHSHEDYKSFLHSQ